VYKGTLNGSRVCIKRLRVYSKGKPEKVTKVRYWRRRFPCLLSPTKPTGLLSRGRNVETLETPKHLIPPRYHYRSSPTHIKLDVQWRLVGIPQRAFRRGPTWTCMYPSCCVYPTLTPLTSYPMSLGASTTSTPAMSSTGTSRVYVVIPNIVSPLY
jgi:hypothetical protein